MLLEEAGVEPVRELGMTLRSLVGNWSWDCLNCAKKKKDVVFTSRHSSSVVLEHGLLKISQMN